METTEQELKDRIKYLQEVIAITPIRKAYKAMCELIDAEKQLKEVENGRVHKY